MHGEVYVVKSTDLKLTLKCIKKKTDGMMDGRRGDRYVTKSVQQNVKCRITLGNGGVHSKILSTFPYV